MSRNETLRRVEGDIEAGRLGVARDRLHGLIVSFPDDLELRSRLGDVYWKLGYKRLAGRYWFLDDPLTDEKMEVVGLFLAECHRDPNLVLRTLKLRVHPESDIARAAEERVNRFVGEVDSQEVKIPKWIPGEGSAVTVSNRRFASWSIYGCTALIVIILFLACVGIESLVTRLSAP